MNWFASWFRAFGYFVPPEEHHVNTYADQKKLVVDDTSLVSTDTAAVATAQAALDDSTATLATDAAKYASSVFAAPGHTVVFVTATEVSIDVSDGHIVTTTTIANSTDTVPDPTPPPTPAP